METTDFLLYSTLLACAIIMISLGISFILHKNISLFDLFIGIGFVFCGNMVILSTINDLVKIYGAIILSTINDLIKIPTI